VAAPAGTTKMMRPYLFADGLRTRILPPTHGDPSGVRGAVWLWKN
jgi:fructokinase